MNWKQLWKKYRDESCERCELSKSAQAVCLMGQGPIPSPVVFVGEAPGFREDNISRPFSGKAGQLLDSLLRDGGLKRESFFITNTCKCRPPDNNTPTLPQIKACSGYLDVEIAAIKPKIIVPLGAVGLRAITGRKSGITIRQGQEEWSDTYGCWVLPAVHPAYILRNPSASAGFLAAIRKLKRFLDNDYKFKEDIELDYRLVETSDQFEAMMEVMDNAKVISYDVETTGLDPYAEEPRPRVVSIGLSHTIGSAYCIPIYHPDRDKNHLPLKQIRRGLERLFGSRRSPRPANRHILVAHNAKFDNQWMYEWGLRPQTSFDTMLAAHVLDENQRKGLKQLAAAFCDAPNWDKGVDLSDAQRVPFSQLGIYNCYDVDYTLRLRAVLKRRLKRNPKKLRIFLHLMMPASEVFEQVERNGIFIDSNKLLAARRECRKNIDAAVERLDELAYGYDSYSPKGVVWNSTKYISGVLYDHLDLPILIRTAKGAPSTAEGALVRLRADTGHPIAAAVLDYRKWQKYWTTYIRRYFTDRRLGDRIHSHYKLHGTRTGRLSSANPNIQQTPRNPFIRGIFSAPQDWSFVDIDYSQIELRLVAAVANEKNMIRAFTTGMDIHLATAASMLNKSPDDVESEERKMAKAVNFGLIYGMYPSTLREYAIEKFDVEMSIEEAEDYYKAFHKSYPAIQKYHRRQHRAVKNQGYVTTYMGRHRHLPDIQSGTKQVAAQAERESVNSPIQGLASDLMLLSMVRVGREINPDDLRLVGSLHDSILMEVRTEAINEIVPKVMEIMANPNLAPFEVKPIPVPIEVEAKVGTHWRGDNPVWSPGS